MIRAVYTPHVACPPELRTYNDDGTRIKRPEEGKSEVEKLGYAYVKYDFLFQVAFEETSTAKGFLIP